MCDFNFKATQHDEIVNAGLTLRMDSVLAGSGRVTNCPYHPQNRAGRNLAKVFADHQADRHQDGKQDHPRALIDR
jgi:hypothetical protein